MPLVRSEKMVLCQIILPVDFAYEYIATLGDLEIVQFRNLNDKINPLQLKYLHELKRCDTTERRLSFLYSESVEMGLKPHHIDTVKIPAPSPKAIFILEAKVKALNVDYNQVNMNYGILKHEAVAMKQLQATVEAADGFFKESHSAFKMFIDETKSKQHSDDENLHLHYIVGIIRSDRFNAFETVLWRVCYGNVYVYHKDLIEPFDEPPLSLMVFKTIFIVFFHGSEYRSKVVKICEGFRTSTYFVPDNSTERQALITKIQEHAKNLEIVVSKSRHHRKKLLFGSSQFIFEWLTTVRKMKIIYHTLNMFRDNHVPMFLIGEFWIPHNKLSYVRNALDTKMVKSELDVPAVVYIIKTHHIPPTYLPTNKFTHGFQLLINAYGLPNYQEMNPALYAIITFPFLFAVMFGDAGHGLIMTSFSTWMVIREKQLEAKRISNEMWKITFGGRYILLLMGLFSIYTGLMYNDVFSRSVNIFGSSWRSNYNLTTVQTNKDLQLDPATNSYIGSPYVCGIDPVWKVAENSIIFANSFKMKLSIIVGIVHMLFGLFLGLVNHIFFKEFSDIVCSFIPQLIFLISLMGYMVFMIFLKWVVYYPTNKPSEARRSPNCAPSILITFINMVLFKTPPNDEVCGYYQMFPFQYTLQKIFVLVALICVPWMLLAKPIHMQMMRRRILISRRSRKHTSIYSMSQLNMFQRKSVHPDSEDEEYDTGELFILQSIHTIEYVINSVSHMASYLRLWALSLAHSQLADVLWTMVLLIGIKNYTVYGGVVTYFAFLFWSVLTVSILVIMEGLSAFLHTLRLHWVEFQSKFYLGQGEQFVPFSFEASLATMEYY